MNTSLDKLRENMVKGQVLPTGATDERLINALYNVDRSKFFHDIHPSIVYSDAELGFENMKFMSPACFALLLHYAAIQDNALVAHIASGFGYGSAVLQQMSFDVHSVEPHDKLHKACSMHLEGISGIRCIKNSLPSVLYDAIVIEGCINDLSHIKGLFKYLNKSGKVVTILHDEADTKSMVGNIVHVYNYNNSPEVEVIKSVYCSVKLDKSRLPDGA